MLHIYIYIYIHTYTYVYLYAHTWHFRIYIYSLVEGFPVISAKVLDGEMVMVLPGFFFSVSEVCQVKKGGFEWKEVRKIWSQLWMSWIINSSWRNFKDGWIAPKTNPLLFIPPTKKKQPNHLAILYLWQVSLTGASGQVQWNTRSEGLKSWWGESYDWKPFPDMLRLHGQNPSKQLRW